MYSQGHILAAVFGTITTALWALQVLGGGFLYKRVRASLLASGTGLTFHLFSLGMGLQEWQFRH